MKKPSAIEKMLAISIAFTLLLLLVRIIYSGTLNYAFYVWNLFLAVIPLLFSRRLQLHATLNIKTAGMMIAWILLLPNAPYLVTDIFHYHERWPVPKWFDLLLVTSAAWNGLMAGFISVMQTELFIQKIVSATKTRLAIAIIFILCGYGIYIGRFLRFNSWDVITNPFNLLIESARHIFLPIEYLAVWKFTLLFSVMLTIIYYTLKQFALVDKQPVKHH